jgi:hypothetical protein
MASYSVLSQATDPWCKEKPLASVRGLRLIVEVFLFVLPTKMYLSESAVALLLSSCLYQ